MSRKNASTSASSTSKGHAFRVARIANSEHSRTSAGAGLLATQFHLRECVDRTYPLRFVRRDGAFVRQDVAQFIDALQQAVSGKWIDRELHLAAVRQGDSLGAEVYCDFRVRVAVRSEERRVGKEGRS